jgi:hypothetical protein
MQMLVFELTRNESNLTTTLDFSTYFLAQVLVARVACVSVEDDILSVGRGDLLAARLIVGNSVIGRVCYIS